MARCHHDNLELDSGFTIEVGREGDILEHGQELKDIQCDKNPGHKGFIPFKDLTLEDIPDGNVEMFNNIKTQGSLVVRLVVDRINKKGEKDPEVATGFVEKIKNVYCVHTNKHVVRNNQDVRNCTIEFNYDFYDRSNVITSRGVELEYTCPCRDYSGFTFDPVPDYIKHLDFGDRDLYYPTIVIMYENGKVVHYFSSVGIESKLLVHCTDIDLNDPQIDIVLLEFGDNSISYLTSSYFKFKPIPSNIQDITNIEIHVDEDDGNSTVISGEVVKFDDEYVVKISESIFQGKIKKCRLVWNGEVISRGTRLYFQQIQSREFFSDKRGVDLEEAINQFPTNVWLFDYQPKPKELEIQLKTMHDFKTERNVCCIGHPHKGIKTVTFGIFLEGLLLQYDIHGQLVEQEEDDQSKLFTCVKYSCKTCSGSSGSPVFRLEDLSKGWLFLIHFAGKKVEPYDDNGTLVENESVARY